MALTGDFALTPAGRAAQDMKGFDGIGAGRRFASCKQIRRVWGVPS